MPKFDGVDYGTPDTITVLKGWSVATDGSVNDIPLVKIPTKKGNKFVVVRSFKIKGPAYSIAAVPDNKALNGANMCELVKTLRVAMSPKSPPASAGDAGNVLVETIDGYRGLSALHWLTGKRIWSRMARGMMANPINAAGNAAGSVVAQALGNIWPLATSGVDRGWMQYQGPFHFNDSGVNAACTGTFDVNLPLIPNEESDAAGFPGIWFNGEGDAGSIQIAFGQTVANHAVSWTGTTVDILADVVLVDREDLPMPSPFKIEAFRSAEKQITLTQAPTSFLALVKPLTAAGAMDTHGYTDIRLKEDGVEVEYYDPDENGRILTNRTERRDFDYHNPAVFNATFTAAYEQAMYTGFGVVLIAADKLSRCRGGDKHGLDLTIEGTTETTHHGVQISHQIRDARVATESTKQAGIPPTTRIVHASKNGNPIGRGLARILPAKFSRG